MLVQDYLREHGLEKLQQEFGIEVCQSNLLPLVILNYSQINSPKTALTGECRGLVLEKDSWNCVGRGFQRFFNYGENLEVTNKFDWQSQITALEKIDGSYAQLFNYNGKWIVTTRGSFALGKICEWADFTWEELFYNCIDEPSIDGLCPKHTYVFELCSLYNKVVQEHKTPSLYLLTVVNTETGKEYYWQKTNGVADLLRVQRPKRFLLPTIECVQNFIVAQAYNDATFEGVVLQDRNGLRLKVKSEKYLALHRLKGNSNIFLPKNLLPFIMGGEIEEVSCYFKEVVPYFIKYKAIVDAAYAEMLSVWEEAKPLTEQKDFANFIIPRTRFSSLLFKARKGNVEPQALWLQSLDLILKILF